MQFSKKATSLIEAMIIMTIVSLGLVGLYDFFVSSERLASNTNKRIKAIQISREGIEGLTNIRNTNWLLYGADYQNCWNVQDYDINCIANNFQTYDISPGSYIIYQDINHRWQLDRKTPPGIFGDGSYRNNFGVEIGADGFYNQATTGITDAPFTREIIISYPEDTNNDTIVNSNDEKMLIKSFVQWDHGGTHKVELTNTLSNWKNKN